MKKLNFLNLLRELGQFTESEINLIFSCLDVSQLDEGAIAYISSPNFIELLKGKFRNAMKENKGVAILELASEEKVAFVDPRSLELTLIPYDVLEQFTPNYPLLFRAIHMARKLDHGQTNYVIISPINDNTLTTYRVDHSERKLGDIVDNVCFNGMSEVRIKHTNFLQLNDPNLHDWVCEYVMKLSERKITLNLEDGLKLDIPSVV